MAMAGVSATPTRRGLVCGGLALGLLARAGGVLAEPPGGDHVINVSNMSFGQIPSGLKVGDTVTWVNNDTVQHTITARDHSFDVRIAPGQSERMTLQKDGTFPFYCLYHSTMRGVLSVAK